MLKKWLGQVFHNATTRNDGFRNEKGRTCADIIDAAPLPTAATREPIRLQVSWNLQSLTLSQRVEQNTPSQSVPADDEPPAKPKDDFNKMFEMKPVERLAAQQKAFQEKMHALAEKYGQTTIPEEEIKNVLAWDKTQRDVYLINTNRHANAALFSGDTTMVFLKGMLIPIGDPMLQQRLGAYMSILNEPLPFALWPTNRCWADELRDEFPWMSSVIDKIENRHRIALHIKIDSQGEFHGLAMRIKIPPLLLHGRPGIGKSRFMKRLGALLNLPLLPVNLAGAADNMFLKGLSQGWTNGRPGAIVEFVLDTGCPNPLVLLDEIDKVSPNTQNGNVHHTLLSFLEPTTARHIHDEFLMGGVDYSAINWIATANSLETIPSVLKSRFTCVAVDGPAPDHMESIVHYQIRDIAKEYGVPVDLFPELQTAEMRLLKKYLRETDCNLRVIAKLVRNAIENHLLSVGGPTLH